ncbi:MAG: 2-phospho-L-lactate guanylyltransferase [Methanomicrobiales archaeon]|nr:2-phospho-L-lactate guanylyltransferase [Methanomicrobiales archaeon]
MSLCSVIPFKPVNPKTRLSSILSREERETFARCMLEDVIGAIPRESSRTVVLATDVSFSCENADVEVVEAGLNDALNQLFRRAGSEVLMVMADLPLADRESLKRLISTEADVAISPGRGGGTNALFLKDPRRFRADFYGLSFLKHLGIAAEFGCSVEVIDSFRLHTDVDEVSDLVEVLIHGRGRSRSFLEVLGFSLAPEEGRVRVKRHTHEEALRGIDRVNA